MQPAESALDILSRRAGISLEYHDIDGVAHTTSEEAKRTILEILGYSGDPSAILSNLIQADATTLIAPAVIASVYAPRFNMRIPVDIVGQIELRIELEGGITVGLRPQFELKEEHLVAGRTIGLYEVDLKDSIPPGQHIISVMRWKEEIGRSTLFLCPESCYLNAEIENGSRWNGLWLQLYALRSSANWGIGDLGDLLELARLVGPRGIRILGLSPLHAPFLMRPDFKSPYSPSSRLYKNAMFVSIPLLPEFAASAKARSLFESSEFQLYLARTRPEERIDYSGVYQWKMRFFEILFDEFISDPPEDFAEYVEEGGIELSRQAIFDCLEERFDYNLDRPAGFHGWPEAFQDASSDAVRAFADASHRRVQFYIFLQYLFDRQFSDVSGACLDLGVCLYADLAVGSHPAGAEVWSSPDAFVERASVGAPPDPFAPQGQDWGLPPLHPRKLVDTRYAAFVDLFERNMPYGGLVRIDHVMALCRLYWVVSTSAGKTGAYVEYPFVELLRLAALVSQRKRCMVIGEDLGTVPGYFRDALSRAELFSWKILFFERDGENFKDPGSYPARSIATLNTHDLPTFLGWMEGEDIRIREALGLVTSFESEKAARERRLDIARARKFAGSTEGESSQDLCAKLYGRLLNSSSAIRLVSIYDLFGEEEQPNLPGTTDEYPCWSMRHRLELSALGSMPLFSSLFPVRS